MKKLDESLLKSNIENIAMYDLENQKVFGSAYCVIQNDNVIYKNCFGNVSVGSSAPVTSSTIFRLASMTKPITAVAVLILVEKGLLSLSDKVSDYLPEYEDIHVIRFTEDNERIDLGKVQNAPTICHLLSHSSGIGSDHEKSRQMTDYDRSTIDKSVSFFCKAGLDFEPGTQQKYSDTGAFDVLVKIIEKVTKTDYLTFLKKEIFEPCGMKNTTFVPSEEQWAKMIDLHDKVKGVSCVAKTKKNCIFFSYPCTHYLGGAGLVSTLDDYVEFAKMLLCKGQAQGKRILCEETFSLMNTAYISSGNNHSWGLGVTIITSEAYEALPVGTFGWSGAYGTHFWIDPTNNVAAVFMKNSLFDGGAASESAINFERAVHDSFK